MEAVKPVISQKEYLKRYLSKDKSKKKKKKDKISSSSHLKRSIIIDDDLGLKDVANVDDEEFNLDYLGDEAPQIAGIVDERPAELRAKEKYNNAMWLDLGEANKDESNQCTNSNEPELCKKRTICSGSDSDSDISIHRPEKNTYKNDELRQIKGKDVKENYRKKNEDTDLSLKRKGCNKYHNSDSDMSPPRLTKNNEKDKNKVKTKKVYSNENSDSDVVPSKMSNVKNGNDFRRRNDEKYKMERERNSDRYSSAHRTSTSAKNKKRKEDVSIKSRRKEYSDSDESPERDRYQQKKNDMERMKKKECSDDSDLSPARNRYQKRKDTSETLRRKDHRIDEFSPARERYHKRKEQSEELRRRDQRIGEISSARDSFQKRRNESDKLRRRKYEHFSDSDPSQSRERHQKSKDVTEKMRRKEVGSDNSDRSPAGRLDKRKRLDTSDKSRRREQKHKSDCDLSPEREQNQKTKSLLEKTRTKEQRLNSDSDLSPARDQDKLDNGRERSHKRTELMVDGKKSGLQSASKLREELKRLKEAENKLFKKMDPSTFGAKAAPVLRDRQTGLIRNLEREKEEERAKAEKRAESEKKYYKWGKGLKQMQDKEDQLAEAIHEMSKPLARYKDDKDLDAFLRAQEREGDPMLEFIKNKQAESHDVIDLSSGGEKPKYNGAFMPNRFGIKPGYRWDGVDRSNGYEKKWFEQKNARKAIEEQAYKWSTSDM